MAKESKENNSNIMTVGLIVVALLVLAGIVFYAWNTKPDTTAKTSTTATSSTDAVAAVDKLGPREVKLTPDNFDATIKGSGVVVVDVYSPTCPHCQKIAPLLTELSNEYGTKVVIAKMSVGVDANRDFILNYDKAFQYVPAIYIYKNGTKVDSFTGERTKAELKTAIDKYLN